MIMGFLNEARRGTALCSSVVIINVYEPRAYKMLERLHEEANASLWMFSRLGRRVGVVGSLPDVFVNPSDTPLDLRTMRALCTTRGLFLASYPFQGMVGAWTTAKQCQTYRAFKTALSLYHHHHHPYADLDSTLHHQGCSTQYPKAMVNLCFRRPRPKLYHLALRAFLRP
jgi:hypothetical protein